MAAAAVDGAVEVVAAGAVKKPVPASTVDQARGVQHEQHMRQSEGRPGGASVSGPSRPLSPSTQEKQEQEQQCVRAWGRMQG